MDTSAILTLIDAEIAQLIKVRTLLVVIEVGSKRGPGRPKKEPAIVPTKKSRKRRKLSAEARAKIAAAQRARWAKRKG